MLSPTKELIKNELLSIFSKFKEKKLIKNYDIRLNKAILLIDTDDDVKEKISEDLIDIILKKLYPHYKSKEILNLPVLHSTINENGVIIEF